MFSRLTQIPMRWIFKPWKRDAEKTSQTENRRRGTVEMKQMTEVKQRV